MVAIVWEIEIREGHAAQFERFYGADGNWTKLSRRSRSFVGSSFLKDIAHGNRYLLLEYWSEMLVYERYLAKVGDEVRALEAERAKYVERIEPIGVFNALNVPDRFGPAWSRRSG
ncbi:MAG TPA: hypothetical protein VEK56_11270 [Vicinamibacterales bacterium]|nr:hypothetical protein [Vicinamibacterales bacterium]